MAKAALRELLNFLTQKCATLSFIPWRQPTIYISTTSSLPNILLTLATGYTWRRKRGGRFEELRKKRQREEEEEEEDED